MPMHDWTRVDDGTYHNFHVLWGAALTNALNAGVLPPDYYAMAEQNADRGRPDLIALRSPGPPAGTAGLLLAPDTPPRTRHTSAAGGYASLRRTIAVRHTSGDEIVALVELVSPGNKSSRHAVRAFVEKVAGAVEAGVHVLLIDPFGPGPRDPDGLHPLIWAEFRSDEDFALPADAPLTAASYAAGVVPMAYVEPFAVGGPVPPVPLFLTPTAYVLPPLDETYTATFAALPARVRDRVSP